MSKRSSRYRAALLLCLVLLCTPHLRAQNGNAGITIENRAPDTALLSSASAKLDMNDTTAAIALLEEFVAKNPRDHAVLLTNQCLGMLYLGQGKIDSARARLIYAISYAPVDMYGREPVMFFREYSLPTARADASVLLGMVYDAERQWERGLYFLALADSTSFPGGYGNAMHNYKGKLSLSYASHFLKAGDTLSAINSLCTYLVLGESYKMQIAKSLRELLLRKHSVKEISREIDKCISGVKEEKINIDGNDAFQYSGMLFGHTVRLWKPKTMSMKDFRKRLKKDPAFIVLRNGKLPEERPVKS